MGIGGHTDHQIISLVGMKLIRNRDLSIFFFEDLPYAVEPAFWGKIHPIIRLRSFVELVSDITSVVSLKCDFLKNYKSQLTSDEVDLVIKYAEKRHSKNCLTGLSNKTKSIEILWKKR